MKFTQFSVLHNKKPNYFYIYEKCDSKWLYKETVEDLLNEKITNEIEIPKLSSILITKTNLFKNKTIDEYIAIFKHFYRKPIECLGKKKLIGLKYIKSTILTCLSIEQHTESIIAHGRHIMDKSYTNDRNKIQLAYDHLKEKGFQDEINDIINFGSILCSSGIYEIVNIRNSKRYIGKSNAIRDRWASHRTMLNTGKHHCKALQDDFNRYGKDAFKYNVVETVKDKDLLHFKERYWWEYTIGEKYNSNDNMMSNTEYKMIMMENRIKELEKQLKIS